MGQVAVDVSLGGAVVQVVPVVGARAECLALMIRGGEILVERVSVATSSLRMPTLSFSTHPVLEGELAGGAVRVVRLVLVLEACATIY